MSEERPNLRACIRRDLPVHGKTWCAGQREQYERECGREFAPETLSRTIREVVREIRRKLGDEPKRKPHLQSHQVETENDLEEYHQIDVASWEPARLTANVWGSEANPNKQVKLTYNYRERIDAGALLRQFVEDAEKHAPLYPRVVYDRQVTASENMVELSIHDLHVGRRSLGEETLGGDWDLRIAQSTFMEGTVDVIESLRRSRPSKITIIVGSDFANSDNQRGTTSKGTPMEEAAHWVETVRAMRAMMVAQIDYLIPIAPVDVVAIRGNHDDERSLFLAWILEAWYRNTDNVTVDTSPAIRKYRRWGECLLGLTHGDEVKLHELVNIMADERKRDWGETTFHEWHVGHLHGAQGRGFQNQTQVRGTRVMVVPSLAELSHWEARKGYRSLRESVGYVWNKRHGIIDAHWYHPESSRLEAA